MASRRPAENLVSLNAKLALAMFPLILVFMIFSFSVVLRHETAILKTESHSRGSTLASSLAIISAEAMRTFSDYQLQENLDQFARLRDVRYALILNERGRVVASTQNGEIGKTPDDPVNMSAQEAAAERVSTVQFDGQAVLDVAQPILVAGRRLGTVRIGMGQEALVQALAQSRRHLQGLTLILLGGAIIFAALLARQFTRPLLALAATAREVAKGDLQARAKEDSNDEIGLLGASINRMATRLQTMLEREKTARQSLQMRVHNLLEFAGRVQAGDLSGEAPTGKDDEMGQLTMAVNEMVRHLRIILEEERSMRDHLEKSRTELEEANSKLKELDLMKSEFLNTVSHELRTPLTSIKAFAEILLDNVGEDPETQTEFLEIINKESDRLTRLINNLLDLSRIEAGRMKWDREALDLHEVVSTAVTSLRGAAEKKGLNLEVDIEEELPTVGDRDKLIQVVTNLLGNAIKFTSEGGTVKVVAGRKDLLTARIEIQDSGVGIEAQHHESIFEKFSQVDSSETRDIKGSGLGLPIARSITEHHDGRLFVESELGKGSNFIVELPLHVEQEQEPPSEDEEPELSLIEHGFEPGQTVLVVDDEPSIRRFLRHILEVEGFLVMEARTGEDAVSIARREKPAIVLLDLVLPDIDGFEVLGRLKQHSTTRHIPVIILSIIEDEERCFRLGASDYLPKPIDRERLVDRVSRLIAAGPSRRAPGTGQVLVVDDDDSVLKAVATILTGHGFAVDMARNGKDALEIAREKQPDLIILDLMMPGMSGHEVLLALKQNSGTAEIPVMILTAAEPDERIRALQGGAESLMTKPFTEKELARLVLGALRGAREDGAVIAARPREREES
jgi:signal transduction histidine kinase/DNA-binding response OmpR family regulator